jgi:parallel beta-helix repeat protein
VFSNTVSDNYHGFSDGIGISIYSGSNNSIYGNTILNNYNINTFTGYGIKIRLSSNNSVIDNNVESNLINGIGLILSSYNYIHNNTIRDHTHCLSLSGSEQNNISLNYIWFNSYAMILSGSHNNTIFQNGISDSGYGIYFYHSKYNTILSNGIGNYGYGMQLESSSNNNMIDNWISGNGGISLWPDSNNNTMSKNTISYNTGDGIYIGSNSNDNTMYENLINNNGYGIRIDSSHDNLIYHNNFEENGIHAYDDTNSGNLWDNGYPSGGNYWDDYDGVDLNRTPTQDVPPPDGLGDTPYIIDSDSQDNYPLMVPYGDFVFLHDGWNLISIPFIQEKTRYYNVLSSISGKYDAIQWYNLSDSEDPWKHYRKGKSFKFNDLDDINHTMGFWVHITELDGVFLEWLGTPPTQNQTIALHPGWNMVGYPSLSHHNRTIGLNNLEFGKDVNGTQWYNTSTQTWYSMDVDDHFVPGRGYWIHSLVETTWEVPL